MYAIINAFLESYSEKNGSVQKANTFRKPTRPVRITPFQSTSFADRLKGKTGEVQEESDSPISLFDWSEGKI
jgi:hypothetical protein